MNNQSINGVSYKIMRDADLKDRIHPCDACDIMDKSDCNGEVGCKASRIHYVLEPNIDLYKEDSITYERLNNK